MAKAKILYFCQNCGTSSPKWVGKCTGCGEWNTMVEELIGGTPSNSPVESVLEQIGTHGNWAGPKDAKTPDWISLAELNSKIDSGEGADVLPKRHTTGIEELDRVLGGGLVPDSFILLGGDPGIGKSTLLLQLAEGLSQSLKILYMTGEESIDQIRRRAFRLGIAKAENIYLAAETSLEKLFATVKEVRPNVLVVDSIQTFVTSNLDSAPGSVSQVREVSAKLMALAKTAGINVWIVGHVTKEGNIAGPKVVEHMVDTVLYFEGDEGQSYRLLRAVKNRFGSARELGVFEMTSDGLEEVKNPSSLFLNERSQPVFGTAIGTSLEGSRPLLIELQALVSESPLAVPRRTSVGMDYSRISLLAAILEKHAGLSLADQDLYFNVAGGLKLSEPACDLAAVAAIWSSFSRKPLPGNAVFIGEVSLTGEVRRVSLPEVRIEEAKKLGFQTAILPKGNLERCKKVQGIELVGISKIRDLEKFF